MALQAHLVNGVLVIDRADKAEVMSNELLTFAAGLDKAGEFRQVVIDPEVSDAQVLAALDLFASQAAAGSREVYLYRPGAAEGERQSLAQRIADRLSIFVIAPLGTYTRTGRYVDGEFWLMRPHGLPQRHEARIPSPLPSGDLQVTPVPPERTTGTAIADDRKGSATRLPDLPRVPRPYGDRLFDTVVGSKDQAVLGTRMGAVAHRIRMPIPDLNGQPILGWDLRLFLADVIEHAQATDNQNVINTLQLDSYPSTADATTPDVLTLPGLLTALRRIGELPGRYSVLLPRVLDGLSRLLYAEDAATAPPGPARTVPELTDAAQWQLRPDGSYERIRYPQPKPARELPLGLRALRPPDRPHGASPSEELVHTLVQMIRTADRHAQVTSDELLKKFPKLGSTPLTRADLDTIATAYEISVQLLQTNTHGEVRSLGLAGIRDEPLFLHHDERPDAAYSYAQLQPDPPGLGRAYTPSSRRATPILSIYVAAHYSSSETTSTPLSTRVELPQATWYYSGTTPAGTWWGRIAEYPGSPGRLNVFLGSPDTQITRELVEDLRRDLDRIPQDARRHLTLVVFGDSSATVPGATDGLTYQQLLRDVLQPNGGRPTPPRSAVWAPTSLAGRMARVAWRSSGSRCRACPQSRPPVTHRPASPATHRPPASPARTSQGRRPNQVGPAMVWAPGVVLRKPSQPTSRRPMPARPAPPTTAACLSRCGSC